MSMDSGDCETEEDSAPEACVSPEGPLLPSGSCDCNNMPNWYMPPLPNRNYLPPNQTFIMDHAPSNNREMRNRAEKMRRDKLNSHITELSTLVPMVARSPKRMDKTSILRLAATYLRIYQTLINRKDEANVDIPKIVDQLILEQLVCEQLKGFLLIMTGNGKIVFVPNTVEHLLGHLQTDLMGQSIFNLISPEDVERFRIYISPNEVADREWRKYFNIHMKRAGPRNESPVYELVNIMGMQRVPKYCDTISTNGKDSPASSTSSSSNDDLWVFFVRVFTNDSPMTQVIEACSDEYRTRHLVDGRIINCDQRISIIAGYMIEEVSGLSAFKFMHREDVRWVMIALRQMYDKGESKGSSCYRLLSRTGQFIYLRTQGFLEVDSTGTVESFICINKLVSEKEGRELIKSMKEKYSPLIKNSSSLAITQSTTEKETVEDSHLLEAAIAHLVTNLPSPVSETGSSPKSTLENQDCSSTDSHSSSTSHPLHIKLMPSKRPSSSREMNSYKRQRGLQSNILLPSPPSYQGATITEVNENR